MELQVIQHKIYEIRGHRVMLDSDLATLYQVQTKVLNQSVKRNIERFPSDFMFQLTKEEAECLRSQFVTIHNTATENNKGPHSKYLPYAFTEQGVAMLSGLLRSEIAIKVNISIMRAFVEMRNHIVGRQISSAEIAELRAKVEKLESFCEDNARATSDLSEDVGKELSDIYTAIAELSITKSKIPPRKPIGYIQPNKE